VQRLYNSLLEVRRARVVRLEPVMTTTEMSACTLVFVVVFRRLVKKIVADLQLDAASMSAGVRSSLDEHGDNDDERR